MKTTVSKSIILKTAVSFLFLIVCISKSTYAQVIQIKGKVSIIIDEEKEVLIGANIFLKGTSIGTSSDKKGLFNFPRKLNKGDILVISYLGFKKQEITVTPKKTYLNILLEEDQTIMMGALQSNKRFKSKRPKQ